MRIETRLMIGAALGLAALALPATAAVQPAPAPAKAEPASAALPLEQGEGRAVAAKLADELVKSFVFKDKAEDYAAMLRRNAAAGRYDQGTRGDLAKLMTDDLLAVHKDGHLHVMLAPEGPRGGPGGGGADRGPPKNWPALIQSAKTIAPGIGYIRFTAFMGRDEEMAAVRKWLTDNRDAKTLIFDLRNHHGGGLDEQDAIFSYLFAKPTPLVKMAIAKDVYDTRGSPLEASATLQFAAEGDKMVGTHRALPGADTPLRTAKVYLLTSNRSASAAEHFALALKTTGRATLIGEATAGANHFGGPVPLNDHFGVWLPIGRTYDIKTGKDWEGDGIAPDIAVDPAQALVVALEKAGLSKAEAERLNATEVPAEPIHSDKLRAR
ncbi:S41 family peptidase [Sphingomonas astaxanthinifaciens]|uniref:Interphotoreceptor retinoid-binding protein n=1 Tax=Sphingomonas astaxanthinifaciens DSM 22298 TaxID=1123267 RepID=A0ABQ5ZC80_9SPHN|nr:S41 family peptidase [Sphingomonas astaxanthinifaciens]GLR48217.1 interphotoreceptor retinoid-binding protein [Sphingomonas astaxanthinifaciens DSM 22298]